MPRIHPQLLERLIRKLNVSRARVYARIQEVANSKLLDRRSAALVLAAQNGIGIQSYATPEELSAIRGTVGGVNANSDPPPSQPAAASRRASSKSATRVRSTKSKDNSVFVVHGRDENLRKSMFEFLRALSLNPLEWGKAIMGTRSGGANPYIDTVIDSAMAKVQAVVVLFSPDDLASLRPCFVTREERNTEGKPKGQPRPNVIFEAGLALGRHPDKTLLVQVGSIRGFSDIAGKHVVRLSNEAEKRTDVANRLEKIGCKVDRTGTDWLSAGDFVPKKDR